MMKTLSGNNSWKLTIKQGKLLEDFHLEATAPICLGPEQAVDAQQVFGNFCAACALALLLTSANSAE